MRKNIVTLIGILLLLATSLAADVHKIPPGDGTLSGAIKYLAKSGDILELEDGGLYTESQDTMIAIDKVLTIKAADGAESRPIIQMLSMHPDSLNMPTYFFLKDGAGITLEFLEFDALPDTTVHRQTENLFLPDGAGQAKIKHIKIIDCYYHDSYGWVVRAGGSTQSGASVDTCIMDNSRVINVRGGIEFRMTSVDSLLHVTNSTFANVEQRVIWAQNYTGSAYPQTSNGKVVMDRCTVHKMTTGKNRYIDCKANPSPVIITNSIFSTYLGTNAKPINPQTNGVFTNNCLWNVPTDLSLFDSLGVVADTVSMDPEFADADNGDFTLPEGSILLTFAADGGAIGDPRWATNATAVKREITNVPVEFNLRQNYPNPFNPMTEISFVLPKSELTTLTVHNLLGQKVATLVNEPLQGGVHKYKFDAADLASGVYYYRLEAGEMMQTRKMMILK